MALEVGQSFKRTSKGLRFEDDVLTKSQMLSGTDDDFETGYVVVDKDTLEQYVYNSNTTPSQETGKFVKIDTGGGQIIQVTTLPTASVTEKGNIYQYVGQTDSNYTNGYFYQCVEVTPATDPKTYEWVQKNVQSSGGGGASLDITTESGVTTATISQNNKNLSFLNTANGMQVEGITENPLEVASKSYVDANAGKIDKIKVNGVEQQIVNKEVNLPTAVNYDYDSHLLKIETGGTSGSKLELQKNVNVSNYAYDITESNLDSGYSSTVTLISKEYADTELAKKQNKLVSGTNIKTINNQSILEPGDLEITGVNEEFEFIDIDLKDYNYTSTQTQDKYTKTINLRNWDECATKAKTKTLIVRIQNTGLSEEQQKLNVRNLKFISTVGPRKLVFGGIIDNNIYTAVHTLHISSSTSSTECAITYTIDYRQWGEGGGSLPAGGTTGQALVKKSDTDGDVEWKTVGGESTIDVIKVNGTAQTITNKEVDLTVATMSAQGSQLNVNGAGIQVYDDDDYLKIIKSDNGIRLDAFHTNSNKQPTSGITNLTIPDKAYVDSNAATITKIKVNGTEQTITNKEVDLAVPNVTAGDHSITVNVPDNSKGFWLEQKSGGVEFGGTHADGDFGTVILTDKTYVDNELAEKGNADFSMSEGYYDLNNANGTSRITFKENTDDFEITFSPTGSGGNTKTIPTKGYVDNAINTFLIVKDTTTYNEILSAFNAKKGLLFCNSSVVDGTSYPAVYALKQTDHILLYVHNHPQIIDVWKVNTDNTYEKTREFVLAENQAIKDYVDGKVGNLTNLTTDNKDNLVNAINEVYEKSGEPFRIKNWANSNLNVTIEPCTTDKSNGELAKMVFSIDEVEGADYQIVGMISYEIFDNTSGGNRLNVWPVCQFTGNGQKELSVRWVCAGSTAKTAKRINAWVLLKHR